ncbi:carbon-nitrogen hydrolase family protein [Primorskyibacter flagellatus]|uniref:Predicted amidohydrolase n=1 Tax=Primorskyibacter flagellatus TaxID=1387277 RepID=A0A1W2E7Y9_9RHOB|nr:carbon-nitrogen hydrolase family protein [Primorskyibacter flagellatus]SMD05883.1 Predicted amidohydrolase [Primorskyibacter flagellatus]
MRIATASYPLDVLECWDGYAAKLSGWVAEASSNGADLLVFPEYAGMELATLAGPSVAGDLEASFRAVSDLVPEADALHADLARRYKLHILAGSAPVFDPSLGHRPVNRARFFAPNGAMGIQDKQIMTRYEREVADIVPGAPLRLFDTSLGRIGVLICYDSEFPLLGRALAEAEFMLVPSCTEALAGHSRVRIGAMARALESQCVTVVASTVGTAPWTDLMDVSVGKGGIFCPPDTGFPATGVMAEGQLDEAGWVYADVDPAAIAHVRRDGVVLNRAHWSEQEGRAGPITIERMG